MRRTDRRWSRSVLSSSPLIVFASVSLLVPLPVCGEGEATSVATPTVVSTGENQTPSAAEFSDMPTISSTPTHRQTAILGVNVSGQPQASLTCFCLTPDDRIVAGCVGQNGELRVFDAEGNYLETWPAPVKPEAIFVQADGRILLAGEGQLVRLTDAGEVELQKQSPHAAEILQNPDKIREEVIQQAKQRAEQFAKQTEVFDQMLQRADEQIANVQQQIATLEEQEDSPQNAQRKMLLERQLAAFEQSKEQYASHKRQWAERSGQAPDGELTEEQIAERVKSSTAYKLKASSVSAAGDDVFLATRAVAGYGYQIWRMDEEFGNGVSIVQDLRGCCGQMDVKANEHGLFVAENSRYRVCHFDREGNSIGAWGFSDRQGIEGFGGCCNPMNVAFGPDDAVYTAEDSTGRIKRYSVAGELLSLVGSVDLVPGCKNVSIAVSGDGSRVYMLDITRHHIVRLDARSPEELTQQASPPPSTGLSGAVRQGIKLLLAGGEQE